MVLAEISRGPAADTAAGAAARSAGNAAYVAGDLDAAASHYAESLACWDRALNTELQPKSLEVGQVVQYSDKGYFGTVMSCYPLFDEYFLKDLGSDQAIWAGDIGRDLRRFTLRELVAVRRELVDFRLAVLQNLAAACLGQEKWEQTVKWADMALCIQGRSPKALMRKGAALLRLNKPGPASDVLATAAEVVPNDREVRRLLRDAEKMRSPMWVCATGCCGPWGIVCGGPIAQTMAEVVAPASKRLLDFPKDSAESAGVDPVEAAVAVVDQWSGAVVDEGAEARSPRGKAEDTATRAGASAEQALEEQQQSTEPQASGGPAVEEPCRARRSATTIQSKSGSMAPPGAQEQRAASMEKGAAGLLWLATGSLLVAVMAAVWLLRQSGGGQWP